ncbi:MULTISPECIES: HlyD family efflux transporter periplasmic adaptor subunit [Anaerotruncus]|jgi:hypothetical protein|uniref:HlyD family secretion protein n=1 Tax=Anaerotruncus colihominis TaxID=169435 RepID=A0A845SS33_9FIRM|nr:MULTISPECIES: HlyD family efflux transporter periplasmic adaptor subunit [Anaerotruncus]MCI8492811.1 hypothetical protein [Anaerotruncus sp.]MCR2025913.1 hypothetical protein [Anaerotruncus colihominis]NDO38535.1 hypothetical protein [Anaerotruncus colihominis]
MKSTLTQRLVVALVMVFLLVYVGYQIWRYVTPAYKTETAFTYTVTETTSVNGVVLRNEVLLDNSMGSGVASYLVGDGAKVAGGTVIAEVYRNKEDARNIEQLRALEKKRAQLERAQDPGTTSFAHTDVLNRQIFSELDTIIGSVESGLMAGAAENADNLLLLMNTKQIATGRQSDFQETINQLKAEERYLSNQISRDPRRITAPQPGYFIRTIDGFEGKVPYKEIPDLTRAQVDEMLAQPVQSESDYVGKVMLGHRWYYAATVPEEDASLYKEGASVTLDFHLSGTQPVPAVVYSVNEDRDNGGAAVIFRCDYINESLVNLRFTQADVKFKSISGLRVSSSAIRYEGIQKGVYVSRGETMQFRPITILYESPGFVICLEMDTNTPEGANGLQQFDEVIIGGAQLYDGKPLK